MLITANGTASLEFTESILREIDFDSDKSIEKTIFMNRFGFINIVKNTEIHIYKVGCIWVLETS